MTPDRFSNHVATERQVANQLVKTLVEVFGYSNEEIMTEVQIPGKRIREADLVVFRSARKVDPFLIFEIKRKIMYPSMVEDIIFQFRDTGAEYIVLTDGKERFCYRFIDGEILEIPDIPRKDEKMGRLSKEQLKPAKNMGYKFWKIMDMMRTNGLKAEDYVEEINKLILAKIVDEQENEQRLKFILSPDEARNLENSIIQRSISNRIRSLFRRVRSRYPDLFKRDEEIRLDPVTLGRAISELQSYSITQASPDVIGAFYEEFISRSMKGSSAQFFTPRQIVDFTVRLADPDEDDTILDPACGSGGFILKTMAHVWDKIRQSCQSPSEAEKTKQDYARSKLFGIDVNPKMVFTSKMNLVLRGDSRSNIFLGNSLLDSQIPAAIKNVIQAQNGFDIVMSNPPMGELLSKDQFSDEYMFVVEKKRQQIESLFLQRCFHFLKPNGLMALVVPEKVLFSRSLVNLRKSVLENGRLVMIISLPVEAFLRYGASIKTSILLIEKLQGQPKEDYNIFMADLQAADDGKGGFSLGESLGQVLERYQEFKRGKHLMMSLQPRTFVLKFSELGADWTVRRYDPAYKMIDVQDYIMAEGVRPRVQTRTLGSIAHITKGVLVRSENYLDYPVTEEIPYIRIGDMQRGTVVQSNLKYVQKPRIKGLSTALVRPGNILYSTRGTIGKVALVPETIPIAIAASQIAIVRVDPHIVDRYYLRFVLASYFAKSQVEPFVTGSIIRYLSIRDLRRLRVPVPSLSKQRKIVAKVKHLRSKQASLDTEKEAIRKQIDEILRGEVL